MMINGRPSLACRTVTKTLETETTLAPLPVFELIGDLSVNTGKWMRAMSERLETWVHAKQEEVDFKRIEAPMDAELAEKIYELDRCIECGCCVAGCGTARMRADFVGAVGLNKIARFRLDPRDARTDADYYELIGDATASSAACRCSPATTFAPRTCRFQRRSPSCAARWRAWAGNDKGVLKK